MTTTADPAANTSRMPVLYLSHGAPPLADDSTWTKELASWSADLPRPESILMVSAHWEQAPLALSATTKMPLIYDFWGFPQRYYEVTYDAPAAPALAADVTRLLTAPGTPVHHDQSRGLDHGAYVPLVEMFPLDDGVDRGRLNAGLPGHGAGVDPAQVVGGEPRPDDQSPLVAQWRDLAADLEQLLGVEGRHRHLQDRDVGLREHLDERDVGAVVQAAALVMVHRCAGSGEQPGDVCCECRGGGRVIRHLVVSLREAPEVIDQRHFRRCRQGERGLLPVGRDHENALRSGQIG